jgi:catechol 2,3-dioxygenase-like lactoylglutathione lyase family enzyme
MLRKIDCVMIRVDNLDVAAAYYTRVLGLRVHWRRERQVGLRMPETDAEIVLHSETDIPPEATVHYLVDDVTVAVRQLADQGCAILVAPFDIEIGKCAAVRDPFGNELYILDMTKGPLAPLGQSGETEGRGRE